MRLFTKKEKKSFDMVSGYQELTALLKKQQADITDIKIQMEQLEKSMDKLALKQIKQGGTIEDLYAVIEEHGEAFERKENIRGNEWKLIQGIIQYDDLLSRTAALLAQNDATAESAKLLLEAEDSLAMQLNQLALRKTGQAGEPIDYRYHEVIDCLPTYQPQLNSTISSVVTSGWVYSDKNVRKAQVTAFKYTEES